MQNDSNIHVFYVSTLYCDKQKENVKYGIFHMLPEL